MRTYLLLFLSIIFSSQLNAQCTPESGFTGSGFAMLPAELDTVESCFGCGVQERVISFRTFTDTTLFVEIGPGNVLEVTVYGDFLRLDSIAGLPDGITYRTDASYDTTYDAVTNPQGYWINEGDTATGFTSVTGCVTLSGTEQDWAAAVGGGPNSDGSYPLSIFIDVRIADMDPAVLLQQVPAGTWLSEMDPSLLDIFGDPNITSNGIEFQGQTLYVTGSGLGIEESGNPFQSVQNQPNPFSNITTITFNLKENVSNLNFRVYDILGSKLVNRSIQGSVGRNTVEFSRNELSSGVYFYSISDGNSVVTRKMIIE